ncbi:Ig-like domain repeat protein [Bariatricus massiliensis]|uniref:Ig-like domain repeat protein n=1 Tax=Bariatricus massiliensis TaxID=1745713 RepID=A0ABS8DHY2_9FIRM|nr:Ig-like domain repeat protein [Bariatricus massiliensis]MCB7304672.1 Ig-like domain repeat protein [Bariatricus massiliensis]MCB7374823.1 Ig-like domain repeat protein [Bariatricus massiliensis]MCB7388050.1 Ig-like domain repeat protein [Bariatricus massiliensis]MCB7411988.1 Ig-like domain repeat protein [Bariatricus massiliensis]MCQ5254221.1 Ig-like domain repeat protein [Bariatricus massiliensis]
MCRKIRATMIVLTFAVLCCCQKVYTRTWGVLMTLAAEGGEEPEYTEIKGYRLLYDEPDGENGFYKSMPRFELSHQDEGLITKYRIICPDGEVAEGQLDTENENLFWEGTAGDGTYHLSVWLEKIQIPEKPDTEPEDSDNEEPEEELPEFSEEELKTWEKNFVWQVDSTPPKIQFLSPAGEGWFRQAVLVEVKAEDEGSGIAGLHGGYGEKYFENGGGQLRFKVESASTAGKPIRIWVRAKDQAGNITEEERAIYIDMTAPVLDISGADNYLISGRNLELTFTVQEENRCGSMEVVMEQENPEGVKNEERLSQWQAANGGYVTGARLEQDGIYRFKFMASDEAGNKTELYRQVILDKTNPIIRGVELFQGKWLKEFCWNYDVADIVEDFTTYTYHLELDGRLYAPGQRIRREGKHILKLAAKDAAGNEAFSSAEFMIDNTPPVIQYEEQNGRKELREGQEFEKEADIQIRTENVQDKIVEIRINGKKQLVSDKSNVYRYNLDEEKPYEIITSAVDRAGNMAEKEIRIQVVKEKSTMKRIFSSGDYGKREGNGKAERSEKKKTTEGTVLGFGVFLLSGSIAAGIYLIGWRQRKK